MNERFIIKDNHIVGVLGGMGPYAALEFHKKVLDYTHVKKDWEHIHIILDNNSKIPSRTRAVLFNEKNPSKYIINSINKLALIGVKEVYLPCNSVHYFYDEIVPYIEIPWINMIKVVSNYILKFNLKNVLVLGAYITMDYKIYNKFVSDLIYLNEEHKNLVYEIIENVKLNKLKEANKFAKKLLNLIKDYNVKALLLACTELTLIDTLTNSDYIIIDTNDIYAKYLVKRNKGL